MNRSPPVPATRSLGRSRLPLPVGTLTGFGLAILAVAVIAVLSYRALESRASNATLVNRTLDELVHLRSLLSSVKDAETGQRGFILTGEEVYLEPFNAARISLDKELRLTRALLADNPAQMQRLDALQQQISDKMAELSHTIELKRSGASAAALAIVRSDRGKDAMDRIRALSLELESEAQKLLAIRQDRWQRDVRLSSQVTWGGSLLLLALILAAGLMTSRDFRSRATEAWIRAGHMGVSERIQGDQRLESLSDNILTFLAQYLRAPVGALYLADGHGTLRRFAGYATSNEQHDHTVAYGEGLVGQAAKENRTLLVTDVPENYLPVVSSLGRATPRHLLVAPAAVDGRAHAVIELGFFRAVEPADRELLRRVSETLGMAVRASKDRTRLEELLEETQRQAEELQTQQEELRVTNEELEIQSRALRESHGQLEAQQVELEQTNSQLEEQTQLLENQKGELTRAQAILTEKAAELARANQYKSEFLANMSHELRTPLNSALILAKILADNKDGNLTAEQVKFAQTISAAGKDLLALINDILDLSKIESGKVEVVVEPVMLANAVETLTKTFAPLAREKGLGFSAQIDAGAPERIETDGQKLGQILRNLVANALKFTEQGSVSLLVKATPARTVAFTIRDTGIGIPAEQQSVVFEAFRQADGSTHRKYGGTGLGLSISRDLARLLGGDISVASVPDKGSDFTLTLPLAYSPRARTLNQSVPSGAAGFPGTGNSGSWTAPASRALHGSAKPPALPRAAMEDDRDQLAPGARVLLIVEDDVHFAAILRDLAHEMGFQCIVTHSANDALLAAATFRLSAILLDINLPDHSGLGVLDQLKRNPHTRHIPVHVASVADFTREALELGAVGYALKPVRREQLVEALQKLEAKLSQRLRRVLVVEDDSCQRESIRQLLAIGDVDVIGASSAGQALKHLQDTTFDCVVMDLNLPDLSGYELLEKMAERDDVSFPPVIIYTGRSLTHAEEQQLHRFSRSIIVKDARSPERLLDEVTLFLHQVEATLPPERQRMLRVARDREAALEGRRILVVEDDVRNIFALSSLLEPKGAKVEIARNGREALDALDRNLANGECPIDLVLMDIMMPGMDGLTAMRELRKRAAFKKLPIIALTAKAMKDDQEKCLAAGANDYIAKPLDVEKLLSLVRVWMPK